MLDTPLITPLHEATHTISTSAGALWAQSWTPPHPQAHPVVLLHDSLGCVALWREFPAQLARATQRQVIAYDRLGFGQSDAYEGVLPVEFIQREAQGGFHAVCQHFGLARFAVLGHSVGGGMAIGCGANFSYACETIVTLSAQAYAEDFTLEGIRQARHQFASAAQRERLTKYHGSKADWVLSAWIDTWLSEAFSTWSLSPQLRAVRAPLLCLHGDQDEYGSLEHPHRIAAQTQGPVHIEILKGCGHMPHREQPELTLHHISAFLNGHEALTAIANQAR